MANQAKEAGTMFSETELPPTQANGKKHGKKPIVLPPNYNKPLKSRVPDFSNKDRRPTCLEIDFPIGPINKLAQQEGNAGKPIYQMSKWWARRRSSVFRSLLLAAATEAPPEEQEFTAAKQIWEAYYANHQQAGSFSHLKVLDLFMGGGTTLVEGARLGMQMRGQDLNPVAWFVVKNELAGSDPKQVKALFDVIENDVKPQIQPFYATSCPRGHQGYWTAPDGTITTTDPIALAPALRKGYRWHGPEIIYTFWGKHAPCQKHPEMNDYRTPVFRSPVVAQKSLTTAYLPLTCPHCHERFDAELGETRMAPAAERVVIPGGRPFTETSQEFAQLVTKYDTGTLVQRGERIAALVAAIFTEPALCCPTCSTFAAETLRAIVTEHAAKKKLGKKLSLGIAHKKAEMVLLIHPAWLTGAPGKEGDQDYGGYVGAVPEESAAWYRRRLHDLALVEVRLATNEIRSPRETDYLVAEEAPAVAEPQEEVITAIKGLPTTIILADGTVFDTGKGTVPEQATCTCAHCGLQNNFLTAVKGSGHSAPVMIYALQCYCPECDVAHYTYSGRFFKVPDADDIARLVAAENEWYQRKDSDLHGFWPLEKLPYAHKTHERDPLPKHGYTHWWTMFNPRQLLVHSQLLQTITLADPAQWPLDVRMQVLGAFQQYLRNQNMFCFWDISRDCLAPHLSNSNYHPKALVLENCVFPKLGRGNWQSAQDIVIEGIKWGVEPWDSFLFEGSKFEHLAIDDGIVNHPSVITAGSSTDLRIANASIDLVITDPPFGDNVFYADLADFFYVWLRIALQRWYAGQPEADYFAMPATPKALEAITNKAEHPDSRSKEERAEKVRPPADEFYQSTLTLCWEEAYRVLKPGGLLAFTFHHSEDEPWVNVLESLFAARFILVATYPIRSDETKGDKAQFGSKKIEYDIIHVCRKRLEEPAPETWPHMRQWVKDEVAKLRRMLETYHGEDLNEADIQVILRGKALEFYSGHYGRIIKGNNELLATREALLGINTLIDEMNGQPINRPPETLDPMTYRFLSLFGSQGEIARDSLHKLLRGSALDPAEFINLNWLREKTGRKYEVVPIMDRFQSLRKRTRNTLKRVIDQAHFLIGAAISRTINIEETLERKGNDAIPLDDHIESLLSWYASAAEDRDVRDGAAMAHRFVSQWRNNQDDLPKTNQLSLFS